MPNSSTTSYDNREWSIMSVSKAMYDQFHKINARFDLNLQHENDHWIGACPLHGGDNLSAFRVYETGTFFCFTRRCVEKKPNLLAFVRLLLNKRSGRTYSYSETVQWLRTNIFENDTVFPEVPKPDRAEFVPYEPVVAFENAQEWKKFATQIPSPWYVNKGFSENTVKRFLIGECHDRTSRFYNRVVVPHFDGEGRVVGITGRTMYPQCSVCGSFHDQGELCSSGSGRTKRVTRPKWLHSTGFRTSQCLYGDWALTAKKTLYLVESVGNVLRLRECGFHNAVAQYGSSLSVGQVHRIKGLIEKYNIPTVVIVPDADSAGLGGAKKSAGKLVDLIPVRIIVPPANDVAVMDCNTVKRFLSLRR